MTYSIEMLAGFFLLGVAVHVVYKWMGWWGGEPGRRPLAYWVEFTPLVVRGMIANLGVFIAYKVGALDPLIHQFAAVVGYVAVTPDTVAGVARMLGVDPATLDLQQLATAVTKPLDTQQPLVAAPIGWAADSIAKSFMPAIQRAARAAVRGATDKMNGGTPPPAPEAP